MQSAVETLSPTKVKLTVEVPFDELKPSLDAAYRKLAGQVRVPGFRPGKVPPRIIDQRLGRGAVLEQAMNDAIPEFYAKALEANDVRVMAHPELELTELADGDKLTFTAEVEVRPQIELPAYDDIAVTVPDADPSDAEVDEQISALRERFAVLSGADHPAQRGDYVSLDLAATIDGEEVEGATATGLSYEVGSDSLVPGLDEQLEGMGEGDTTTFTTQLGGGEPAGRDADVTVTVRGVKVKDLPELDDDFACTASEFDTLDELRSDVRSRFERIKRLEQGVAARDAVLEELLARVEVPLPEGVVASETEHRWHSMDAQLEQAGLTRGEYLEHEGRSADELEAEMAAGAASALKGQLVLDAIAEKEQVGVEEAELIDQIVRRAQRLGVAPDTYMQHMAQQGQLPGLVSEVRRGKALALVLEAATITDASGRPVDLGALREEQPTADDAADEAADDADEVAEVAATHGEHDEHAGHSH